MYNIDKQEQKRVRRNRQLKLIQGGEKLVRIVSNLLGAVRDAGGSEEDLIKLDVNGSPLLAAIARLIVVSESIVVSDPEEHLVIAMLHAGVSLKEAWYQPAEFAGCLGDVGELYIVVRPPRGSGDDQWGGREEVISWLAGMKSGEHEPATLADGLRFVSDGMAVEGSRIVCAGSVCTDGGWSLLETCSDGTVLTSYDKNGEINRNLSFLLRKTKKPVTMPIRGAGESYEERFDRAVEECGFTECDREYITPENFPGETFDGGDYDLEWRLPEPKFDGYDADGIDEVVRGWKHEDNTVLGGASAGDGLFLAKEFRTGHLEQPDLSIICPGSTSVNGEVLSLYRNKEDSVRIACVHHRDFSWGAVGVGNRILLRKAKKPVAVEAASARSEEAKP